MITLNPGESIVLRANKNLGVSYHISGIHYSGTAGTPKKLSSGFIETSPEIIYTSPVGLVTTITSIILSNGLSNEEIDTYIYSNSSDPHNRLATISLPAYGYSEWSGGLIKVYDKDGSITNTAGGAYQLNSYFP